MRTATASQARSGTSPSGAHQKQFLLKFVHEQWIESALASGQWSREPQWSEAIAVGRRSFVEDIQRQLGLRARYRQIAEADGLSVGADEVYGRISGSKWAA